MLKDKIADIIFETKEDKQNSSIMNNFQVNTKIYFKDIDGNMYSQLICGSHIDEIFTTRYLQLTEPFEIELGSPESEGFIL